MQWFLTCKYIGLRFSNRNILDWIWQFWSITMKLCIMLLHIQCVFVCFNTEVDFSVIVYITLQCTVYYVICTVYSEHRPMPQPSTVPVRHKYYFKFLFGIKTSLFSTLDQSSTWNHKKYLDLIRQKWYNRWQIVTRASDHTWHVTCHESITHVWHHGLVSSPAPATARPRSRIPSWSSSTSFSPSSRSFFRSFPWTRTHQQF